MSDKQHSKEVGPRKEHILFEIHKKEKDLERRLEEAKEDAKKIVAEARADAERLVRGAKEERLKKELALVEAELAKQNEEKKKTVVDVKDEVSILKAMGDKNRKKAVELVLSKIL